jgi:hypothetical protein
MLQGEAPATGENREGATIRLIRKPEDVSNCWGWKPVDRVSWRRSSECCREALFVFYN